MIFLVFGHVVFPVTGSLLVACGQAGAYTIGSDIDFKLLHGLGLFVF